MMKVLGLWLASCALISDWLVCVSFLSVGGEFVWLGRVLRYKRAQNGKKQERASNHHTFFILSVCLAGPAVCLFLTVWMARKLNWSEPASQSDRSRCAERRRKPRCSCMLCANALSEANSTVHLKITDNIPVPVRFLHKTSPFVSLSLITFMS